MATIADKPELEINLLRTFLAVVQHGSLGRTATACAMTQPAISQQIMRLEKIIGKQLFARSRDGVTLTRHGELLIAYATRAIELSEDTLARLQNEGVDDERVRLGLSANVSVVGFTPTLKSFQMRHPEVEVKVVVADHSKLENLLKEREIDLVVTDPSQIPDTPILVWQVPLIWAASADFRLARNQILPVVLLEEPSSWRQKLLASLGRAGCNWRIACESTSFDAVLSAVKSGLGVSSLTVQTIRNSGLQELRNFDLLAPPPIELGLFRATGCHGPACLAMEAALIAGFSPRGDDTIIPRAAIINTELIKTGNIRNGLAAL
jgi:DNA-binding transcriptional LysR family regulator